MAAPKKCVRCGCVTGDGYTFRTRREPSEPVKPTGCPPLATTQVRQWYCRTCYEVAVQRDLRMEGFVTHHGIRLFYREGAG